MIGTGSDTPLSADFGINVPCSSPTSISNSSLIHFLLPRAVNVIPSPICLTNLVSRKPVSSNVSRATECRIDGSLYSAAPPGTSHMFGKERSVAARWIRRMRVLGCSVVMGVKIQAPTTKRSYFGRTLLPLRYVLSGTIRDCSPGGIWIEIGLISLLADMSARATWRATDGE